VNTNKQLFIIYFSWF